MFGFATTYVGMIKMKVRFEASKLKSHKTYENGDRVYNYDNEVFIYVKKEEVEGFMLKWVDINE